MPKYWITDEQDKRYAVPTRSHLNSWDDSATVHYYVPSEWVGERDDGSLRLNSYGEEKLANAGVNVDRTYCTHPGDCCGHWYHSDRKSVV